MFRSTNAAIRGRETTAIVGFAVAGAVVAAVAQTPTPAPGGEGRQGGGRRGLQAPAYPVLAIGSDLPDFSLPGVDDKRHSPSEFKQAKVLAIMFESNHCPASLAYQERAHQLLATYQGRGFSMILINPNNPRAVRLNELGYTDMSDSFEE